MDARGQQHPRGARCPRVGCADPSVPRMGTASERPRCPLREGPGAPGRAVWGSSVARGVPGCRGSCVGCPWAQHLCVRCPRDKRRCCPQRGMSGSARQPCVRFPHPLGGFPRVVESPCPSHGVPSIPAGRPVARSSTESLIPVASPAVPQGVWGPIRVPTAPQCRRGPSLSRSRAGMRGPGGAEAGAGTGSECAVLMSAAHPRQLCAFPFFCLLLLFVFLLLPAAALGLSWSPDSSPTGLPALCFISLAAKYL